MYLCEYADLTHKLLVPMEQKHKSIKEQNLFGDSILYIKVTRIRVYLKWEPKMLTFSSSWLVLRIIRTSFFSGLISLLTMELQTNTL